MTTLSAIANAAVCQAELQRELARGGLDRWILRDLLEELARTRPDMNMLFETMLDIDEGLQEWRYRHVQLVRRTIGDKTGTGGSPGVEYLKKTVYEPAFPDLWAIRARF